MAGSVSLTARTQRGEPPQCPNRRRIRNLADTVRGMTEESTSSWLAAEDLTASEAALVEATLAHRWWEPAPGIAEEITDPPRDADWGPERTVRAQVLYQLLTGQGHPGGDDAEWAIAPRALRVRGARIIGQLDLEAATLRCPLELESCWFDHDTGPVLLRLATAPSIDIRDCWLPAGLDARQLTTRGNVDLTGCRIQGEVLLVGGQIGGLLRMYGGKLRNKGKTAINASGLQIDQAALFGEGFEADGAVLLVNTHVAGLLDFSGGKFRNEGKTAINAGGLQIDHAVTFGRGFEADGAVRIADAYLGGTLTLTGKFRNEGKTALDAKRLQIDGDLSCLEFEADGTVNLFCGHVGGEVWLNGKFRNQVSVLNKSAVALEGDSLQVGGSMFFGTKFEADGELRLAGGHVGGELTLGGKFRNGKGTAIDAPGLRVDQSISLTDSFEADGTVYLAGCHTGDQLILTGKFRNGALAGKAIQAQRVRVDGELVWEPAKVIGRVSFAYGSVGVWTDDAAVLGIPLSLHGLRYDALSGMPPSVSVRKRIAWLERDWSGYSPQPFSHLAAVYRAEGHDRAARQVLIASQTRRRRQISGWPGWPGRVWSGLLRATVGYGYRPWLALLWLLALVTVGALVVDVLPDSDFEAGSGAPPFNSLLYTVDVLLPFIDLGYSKWVAVGAAQTVTVALVVFGWVLATAVIAAFAGVLRRGD